MRNKSTEDELDAAILAALREARGEVMAWATLRGKLPEAGYWAKVEALTRLECTGRVDVVKVDGRNYVSLSMIPGYLRARGVA